MTVSYSGPYISPPARPRPHYRICFRLASIFLVSRVTLLFALERRTDQKKKKAGFLADAESESGPKMDVRRGPS